MITLFESTDVIFTTNGLGGLDEAVSCLVPEELNGKFELEMQYPITGRRYGDLKKRRIILAKSNPYSNPQPFRIYAISKPINGIVTVNAEHISYDLSGYPVDPFAAGSVADAIDGLRVHNVLIHPFTFSTDKITSGFLDVKKPSSIRSILGGRDGSILEVYGGEYKFDGYTVQLLNNRGLDRGVSIQYGKNLTDIRQDENCQSVYTGVYPYWYSDEDGLVTLPQKIVYAEGTYDFVRIFNLDLSSVIDHKPTDGELLGEAQKYMTDNKIGIPKISISISFIPLSQSTEYKNYALLETVLLGDTVTVEFPLMQISATAKCVATLYDAITDKYVKIELGDAVSKFAATISDQAQTIRTLPEKTKSFMQAAVENATKLITGGLGGYVVLHDSSGGSMPDEILIMNTDDIQTAAKVWRWNMNGLGYSNTGYDGPYGLAMTMDGAIVANFITVGELEGALIKAGSIKTEAISVLYKQSVTDEISGAISNVEQEFTVANGALSSRITTAEGDISTIDQYAHSLTLSVTNETTSSTIQLKAGQTLISSQSITMSGVVTFTSLATEGQTTINGRNITTGYIDADLIEADVFATKAGLSGGTTVISGDCIMTGQVKANYIGPNNGMYISFTSPLMLDGSYPDISGINTLYFSNYNLISDDGYVDQYHGLRLYSAKEVHIDSLGGLLCSKYRSNGNLSMDAASGYSMYLGTTVGSTQIINVGNSNSTINLYGTLKHGTYTVLDSGNISSYVVFQ